MGKRGAQYILSKLEMELALTGSTPRFLQKPSTILLNWKHTTSVYVPQYFSHAMGEDWQRREAGGTSGQHPAFSSISEHQW